MAAASFACAATTIGYSEQWLVARLGIADSVAISAVLGSCAATVGIAVAHSDSRSFDYHG